MKVLVDIASIAKRAMYAGKDTENGFYSVDQNGKEVFVNSAQYGYDNTANSIVTFLRAVDLNPKDMIIVFDGQNATSARKQVDPLYKSGRTNCQALHNEYNRMISTLTQDLLNLGAQTAKYDYVEADDLIGWFCEYYAKQEPVLIWTYDHDLLVCCQHPNVSAYVKGEFNPKPYGDFPYEFIDVYKATVGDSSDNISGAKGFGPKSFEEVYKKFGDNGMKVLRTYIQGKTLLKLEEDLESCPKLKPLIDYAPLVEKSLKLATLMTDKVQPEKIVWQHGMCKGDVHPFLSDWQQQIEGVTEDNFDDVMVRVRQLLTENNLVSMDIETSTSEESDNWLETNGKQGGVDVYGSRLTGFSLTLGGNFHRTYYFSVNHADTRNCTEQQWKSVFEMINPTHRWVVHNSNFELVVLHNELGYFLKDIDDTKLMASYVDENESLGLKPNSKRWLGYDQTSYEETVTDPETGRKRKMDELSLSEVLAYGADDTLTTAALYNWFKLHMQIEGVWDIYRKVEIGAAFWVAQAFIDGVKIDQVALSKMIARDKSDRPAQEAILDKYLTNKGWEGSLFIEADEHTWHTPQWVKYAFHIMTGKELDTRVKLIGRLIQAVSEQGCIELAAALELGDLKQINTLVRSKFKGKPQFNAGSPKQMQELIYEVMKLPVRIRNKPTDNMRARGVEGSPSTDDAAIQSALHFDLTDESDERRTVLQALLKIKVYNTREGLYYKPYPTLPHWKDGKIRSSFNQCATVTRRFSSSMPNLQQLSKGAGDFRTIFVPHHKDALIVSLDFSAQELRLTAHASQDSAMLSCYIGEHPRDMHSITWASIADMPYDEFKALIDDESHPKHKWAKQCRANGKTVNFAELYGSQAKTMSQKLMVTEAEAQAFLDAKAKAFPIVNQWKSNVIEQAHKNGYSSTMLGARRHLKTINSSNKWEKSKAERQSANFVIQGSGAEMAKLAMGRIWESNVRNDFDVRFFAQIHDETVFSIAIKDIPDVVPILHQCMTAQYADMSVPIESSVSMGRNFGDQHEMGDGVHPTPDNLKAFIAKHFG